MINDIFRNVNYMQKGLDASWLNNEVISNNIANIDTPNFKRSYVNFDALFKSEIQGRMKVTRDKHIPIASETQDLKVIKDDKTTVRMDGNNVDIEYEEAELAKNQIWYNYMVQKVSQEFRRLKLAINEGR